jgi:hypothetical protein
MLASGYALLTTLWVAAATALVLNALLYTAALEARATLEETQYTLATPQATLAMVQAARVLGGPLHDRLRQEVQAYSVAPTAAQWLALTRTLQGLSDQYLCTATARIHFSPTACGQPLPSNEELDTTQAEELAQGLRRLPFAVVATVQGSRQVVRHGEFRLRIGPQPVTRYALLSQGEPPPFTSEVFLGGPVWINGFPQFVGQPLFGDGFASSGCRRTQPGCPAWQQAQAQFGSTWLAPMHLSPGPATPCYAVACPILAGGVDWSAPPPPWPLENTPLAVARPTSGPQGLVLEGSVESMTLSMINGTTRIQICQSRCSTYTLRNTQAGARLEGPNNLVITPFAGVIHVNGSIRRLSAVQPAYAPIPLTLAALGDITLNSSLTASQAPCTEPSSRQGSVHRMASCPTEQPLLGLYSHTGQLWLDSATAITLHAAVMLRNGRLSWKTGAGSLWFSGSLAVAGLDWWPQQLIYPPYLGPNPPPGFPTLDQVRESWLIYSIQD